MSRFMRILVFFDLPVTSAIERKQATQFRNFLIKDGFYMIQFSLYGRVCNTLENAELHQNRVAVQVPASGSVRSMIVTENQYSSMKILCGKPVNKEKQTVKSQQISFF